MRSAKITSKGQVTIPKQVRDELGLKSGDTIFFYVSPDHLHAVVEKVPNFLDLKGALREYADPDDPDLKKAIKAAKDDAIVGRYLRTFDQEEEDADGRAA